MSVFKNKKLRLMMLLLSAALFGGSLHVEAAGRVQPTEGEIVIVIDPGHGGDNMGTESGHTCEKEMTLVTAKAMLQELERYDNVKAYLTRSDDTGLPLKDRAEFAAWVGADFLFSIHYNASENHNMFGSEVWVSCETPYNAYGYQFGYQYLRLMEEKGLFLRGVKTRINDGEDYYGILRESAAREIPAVIIEHCHVDEERDAGYIENEEDWVEFGKLDALSVAKYFGLKSESLGVDYSAEAEKLQDVDPQARVQNTLQDGTPPDICTIELKDCDYDTGRVVLNVSAADYDSLLLYYDYSLDGGQTWSRLEVWPGCDALDRTYHDIFELELQIPDGTQPNIVLRAYNRENLYTAGNSLTFDRPFSYEGKEDETVPADRDAAISETALPDHSRPSVGTTTFMPTLSNAVEKGGQPKVIGFLILCLILVLLLFLAEFLRRAVSFRKRQKRRRDRTRGR